MGDKLQFGELVPLADFVVATGGAGPDIISVQLMRPGEFIDALGRPITITEGKLDAYERNFNAGVAGQQLPVFVGHPPISQRAEAPAGGWFKRLYTKLQDGVKTLWADLELSALGKEVLGKKLYRYISATVDTENDVIMGAGFCNLPAITGMAAIELSQFLHQPAGGEAEAVGLLRQLVAGIKRLPELFAHLPGLADLAIKTVDGQEYPQRCFLSTPDASQPSTWGLRVCEIEEGSVTVTVAQLGRAAAALGPGFRGSRYQLKEGESRDALQGKLVALYRRQGVERDDIPEYLFSEGDAMGKLLELTEEQLQATVATAVQTALSQRDADLTAALGEDADLEQVGQVVPQLADLLKKHDEERWADYQRQAERKNAISEFVRTVTDGEAALSTTPDDLTEFLSGLTDDQLETAQAILKAKVADLSERGHTGAGDGLKPLPAEAKAGLDAHLAQGGELQDFIDGNPELKGSDFSAYQPAE